MTKDFNYWKGLLKKQHLKVDSRGEVDRKAFSDFIIKTKTMVKNDKKNKTRRAKYAAMKKGGNNDDEDMDDYDEEDIDEETEDEDEENDNEMNSDEDNQENYNHIGFDASHTFGYVHELRDKERECSIRIAGKKEVDIRTVEKDSFEYGNVNCLEDQELNQRELLKEIVDDEFYQNVMTLTDKEISSSNMEDTSNLDSLIALLKSRK